MKLLERGLLGLCRLIIGSLILFSILLNGANTAARYLFASPIYWAEELLVFILVWCVFIGAVLVTWDGAHLRMDLFSNMLPERWRKVLNAIGSVILMAVCAIIAVQSWQVSSMMARLDQRSIVGEIPMLLPHSAILVGFSIMFLVVLIRFRTLLLPPPESLVPEDPEAGSRKD